ncbi:MAG: enoyl-CoA hydratase/isomerase family protein [Candidatus Hermodarchaeota archaeon]
MGNELIIVENAHNIGKIILNNGPFNILTIKMMEQINEALEGFLEDQSLKAVIFDHTGKAFSAGVDIGDHIGDKAPIMIKEFHRIFRNLNKLKCLTIASIKGAALGGGCEIAIFCDIVLTSDKAKFGQPEIKLGVFPPLAVLTFPQIIGNKKAFELIMLGEIIDAKEAHQLGISNYVFPIESYEQEFSKFIEKLNDLSTIILHYTKKAFNVAVDFDFETQLNKVEEFYLKELMATHDANEGLRSFLEKRSPNWQNQ